MTLSSEPNDTLSADEREAIQVNVEGWQLFWRFVCAAGLIVGTLGVATLVADWTLART